MNILVSVLQRGSDDRVPRYSHLAGCAGAWSRAHHYSEGKLETALVFLSSSYVLSSFASPEKVHIAIEGIKEGGNDNEE